MRKNYWLILLAAVIAGGLAGYLAAGMSGGSDNEDTYFYAGDTGAVVRNVSISGEYPDFTYAAESSVNAVVYVKVVKRSEQPQGPSSLFEYFFGFGDSMPREQVGTGSGVIISEDGFIVTNNHVVSGATEIEVTVGDKKTFKAEIVGTDPATDVALLKIDAKGLPTIPMGDSDKLRLGEWVLAIGSPYGLTSTITAGIVSAKGRSMPNYSGEFKIESFIQTDAAVNPGNSGGALVNIKGELVGINTAIVSQTGSYTGYSFAVPVNIVKKIVSDFKEYGSVQRAMLGISMINNSESLKEEMKLSTTEGVYIAEVVKGGAAEAAGVRKGDILLSIDSVRISKGAAVQEIINSHRPGDKVTLEILRDGKTLEKEVTLIGKETQEMNAYNRQGNVNLFGAQLVPAPKDELEKIGIKAGVKVESVEKGKIRDAGIREGFIITYINNSPVVSPQDVAAEVRKAKRSLLIEGFYPDGNLCYYGIGL
ncbi:MAG TPA: Do family serine endopeptidase [Candidatus Coprenecus stercoravium]|uniref:Do family serine endopeptidase n=1 Tax=Candidatus Coprenecus stercoravium TaxID=2840735 RepID=A0A9D2GRT9_9BACT|nr:Do family serine endopeptidase [Candidatus Coprenecus stercoravium]